MLTIIKSIIVSISQSHIHWKIMTGHSSLSDLSPAVIFCAKFCLMIQGDSKQKPPKLLILSTFLLHFQILRGMCLFCRFCYRCVIYKLVVQWHLKIHNLLKSRFNYDYIKYQFYYFCLHLWDWDVFKIFRFFL